MAEKVVNIKVCDRKLPRNLPLLIQVTVMGNPRTGEKQLSFSANGQNGQ